MYFNQLEKLKSEAKLAKYSSSKSIDTLIRKNLITTNMASSVVNDSDTVNNLIKMYDLISNESYEHWYNTEANILIRTVHALVR